MAEKTLRRRKIQEQNSKLDFFKNQYLEPKKEKTKPGPRGRGSDEDALLEPEIGKDKKPKKKKKMSEKYLLSIIKADPTSIVDQNAKSLDDVKKVGGYTQWIVNQYFKLIPNDFAGKKDERYEEVRERVRVFFEDLYKIHDDLVIYHRFSKRIQPPDKRDINKIAGPDDLYNVIKDVDTTPSGEHISAEKKEKAKRVLKQDASIEYEDDKWEVIIPHTPLASYELAGEKLTRWCTAQSKQSSYHTTYSKDGPLYIIRDKTDIVPSGHGAGDPRPVYQFHFPSTQFMDAADRSISLVDFLSQKGNEGLKQFFKPIFEKTWIHKTFDVDDKVFQAYLALYGKSQEMMRTIENILKKKVESPGDVTVNDDSGEYRGFVKALGYEEFLHTLFSFLTADKVVLEVTYKNYTGKGLDIPEVLGSFPNLKNVVFYGFAKSIPASIGNLENLELLSLSNNPQLNVLPAELGKCHKLEILNLNSTPVAINKLPPQIMDLTTKGKTLIIQNS